MKSYIAFGNDLAALEKIVAEHDITIGYRGKHVPVYELRTVLPVKTLKKLLPEYRIHEQKTYEVNNDQ